MSPTPELHPKSGERALLRKNADSFYPLSLAAKLSCQYLRDIEELLASRGILVSNETIRVWCLKFGQTFANTLRRKRPVRGDKWHLDEVYLTIKGKIQAPPAQGTE